MRQLVKIVAFSTLTFLSTYTTPSSACTGIMLKNADGTFVHGRTLEFALKIDTEVTFIPRNYSFTGNTPLGKGKTWKAKYAALGVIAFDNLALLDGFNEKGLSVGAFYFPGYAKYTDTTKENQLKSMSMSEFPNWLLTSFATVEEIKVAIAAEQALIAPTLIPGFPAVAQPFHYIVYDKSGKSIVIEPIDGRLKVHDNPLGVLTNSPSFDWHMTNLKNYLNLSVNDVKSVNFAGQELKPLGQGSGMLGLPGDFTPPSRFIRAAIYSQSAIPEKNADKGILKTFHILNNFDIPIGVSREKNQDKLYTDYTMLTVARDPQALKYYWKSYDDQAIRQVDMSQLDFNAKEVKKLSTAGKQTIIDATAKIKQ